MQAEVASWDLTMRAGAGTVADDPRNPDVNATLNKWRGEADAMLTLAVSNDPNAINCNDATKSVRGMIDQISLLICARCLRTSAAPVGRLVVSQRWWLVSRATLTR